MSFADGILTARTFAGKRNQHIRANQELLAFSGMSAAAGITQGFPLGASGSRTAVNDQMGARTQVAGFVAAGAIAIVLLFLTTPMSYLPSAVLGAVIVSAAIGLVDLDAWRGLATVSRFEVGLAATTVVGVAVLGVLQALTIAVALSIVDVVRRSAQPHDAVLGWVDRLGRYANVQLHRSARVTPGVVVYRLDDRLFFANARYVKGRVREAVRGAPDPARWLVFDAGSVAHVDSTGVEALGELTGELRRDGVALVVARMRPYVHESLSAAGVAGVIGEDRFFPTVRAAVAYCSEPVRRRPAVDLIRPDWSSRGFQSLGEELERRRVFVSCSPPRSMPCSARKARASAATWNASAGRALGRELEDARAVGIEPQLGDEPAVEALARTSA